MKLRSFQLFVGGETVSDFRSICERHRKLGVVPWLKEMQAKSCYHLRPRKTSSPPCGRMAGQKEKSMTTVHDVVDYITLKLDEAKSGLNTLKLQKLAYYTQAWRLALRNESLFKGGFQAWIHGPVNRELYDRFSKTHMMYDLVKASDIRPEFDLEKMPRDVREHIDEVLEAYARFSGPQLESMTHDEEPWVQARGGRKPSERCETEIDEALMASFYKKMLEESDA